VQDQPVVSVAAERLRYNLLELGLNLIDVFAWRETGPVGDAKHMRVDGERLFPKSGIEDDVRGFPADAGKSLQFFACPRDQRAIVVDQCLAQRDDVLGLGIEQADGLDRVAERLFTKLNHLLGCGDPREQRPRRDVHAGIGGLRGQHDGYEQLIGVAGLKLGRRRGVRLREPAEEFENLIPRHWAPITSRIE
jgi:hypothetical protein